MSLNNHRHGGENHRTLIGATTNSCYVALSPHDDMESLAYAILELQIGRLPWENCMTNANAYVSKQKWTGEHWTATIGCPKAFGDFLDTVRDRGQALDYARWKEELCGNSTPIPPCDSAPYLYDPLDDSAPIRRDGYEDLEAYKDLTESERARVPKSPEPWSSVPGGWDGFHPRSTWSGPVTLEEGATFGDERELFLRELALIDRPPTCGASLRADDPSEVMSRFDDLLGKNLSRAVGEDVDGDRGDGRSGSETVDSRYGSSSEGEGSDKDRTEVTHEAGDGGDVHDDSDFRQFYDQEYGRM